MRRALEASRNALLACRPNPPVGCVVVGTLDPHPRNQGAGLRMLEQAGIPVTTGVLETEVLRFLAPYLRSH